MDNFNWEELWLEYRGLLMTDGKYDESKIKNELHDLVFVMTQVGKVYNGLTGGILSKPMYFADVILNLNEDQITESYNSGYEDGKNDTK